MPVTEPAVPSLSIATRIATVLAAELGDAVEHEEFGLLVQDINPIDTDTLTAALAQPRFAKKARLRMVLVDDEPAIQAACDRHPVLKDLISHKEETAVAWRNKHLKTIAVIARGPWPRLRHYASFAR